jgi:hypothetical protein
MQTNGAARTAQSRALAIRRRRKLPFEKLMKMEASKVLQGIWPWTEERNRGYAAGQMTLSEQSFYQGRSFLTLLIGTTSLLAASHSGY